MMPELPLAIPLPPVKLIDDSGLVLAEMGARRAGRIAPRDRVRLRARADNQQCGQGSGKRYQRLFHFRNPFHACFLGGKSEIRISKSELTLKISESRSPNQIQFYAADSMLALIRIPDFEVRKYLSGLLQATRGARTIKGRPRPARTREAGSGASLGGVSPLPPGPVAGVMVTTASIEPGAPPG